MAILAIVALVQGAAWLPVVIRFMRNWRSRKNPESMAIMFLASLASFFGAVPYWLKSHASGVLPLILAAANAIVCVSFYVAFIWARNRFQDERR